MANYEEVLQEQKESDTDANDTESAAAAANIPETTDAENLHKSNLEVFQQTDSENSQACNTATVDTTSSANIHTSNTPRNLPSFMSSDSSDLHQDLELSESSDDENDELTVPKQNPGTSVSVTTSVIVEVNSSVPEVTENGGHETKVGAGETAERSDDKTGLSDAISTNPEDVEKEQGRMENGSPSRVANERSSTNPEFNRSTASLSQSTAHISSSQTLEISHSRKRTRISSSSSPSSSSSSSSSASSSSSSSSSESSSDSSGSSSEDDERQSDEDRSSNATPESGPAKYLAKSSTFYNHPTYAAHQTSTPVLIPPTKRYRGRRPVGSLNRDKNGMPAAKKFRLSPSASHRAARSNDEASTPGRKYRKNKKAVGRSKTSTNVVKDGKEKEGKEYPVFPESDLETEESGSEEVFHKKQLTEPVRKKVTASHKLWSMTNEEYLLRLLRGVENLQSLRLIAERKGQDGMLNKQLMMQESQQRELVQGRMTGKGSRSTHSFPNQEVELNLSQPPRPTASVQQSPRRSRGRGKGRGRGRETLVESQRNMNVPKRVPSGVVTNTSQLNACKKKLKATAKATDAEIWCVCRKPFEDRGMIACDFKGCPIQWYHLDCLGLTQRDVPKGKWFCKIDACKQSRTNAPVTRKRKRQTKD